MSSFKSIFAACCLAFLVGSAFAQQQGKSSESRGLGDTNAAAALAGRGAVEIIEVFGEVDISPGGDDSQAYRLAPRTRVRRGDRIVTGMDARAKLRFPDGHIAEVGELTDMKVAASSDVGNLVRTLLWLRGGRISAQVNKGSERPFDFAIKTPTATIGTRGTQFTVRYNVQTGVTTISVTEGAVEVTPENSALQRFMLRAIQQVEIASNKVSPITGTTTAEENSTLEGRRPVTVSEEEGEGRSVSTQAASGLQRIVGLWRLPEAGSVIEIRPDGTGIYNDPGPGAEKYGIKRGDITFKNVRAVGDAFEATVMLGAGSLACPNSARLPVKGTIRIDPGGDAFVLTSTGYYFDPSSCQWTNIVLGSFTRTYHRTSARRVDSETKN